MVTHHACKDCSHDLVCSISSTFNKRVNEIKNLGNVPSNDYRIDITCTHFVKKVLVPRGSRELQSI